MQIATLNISPHEITEVLFSAKKKQNKNKTKKLTQKICLDNRANLWKNTLKFTQLRKNDMKRTHSI